ncbi:tRNA-splicing endonuclease subunit Sen34 [Galleria mellonella]|uniref:tRNA-splicing endonuclease subunit Sen34 n=1 Tax=Galleria mellonella TaxID=7137 RepID=A0A6J1X0Y6_GALME|nr:tRNA-splicing endonuclease subunit Sen34 [Galleria mellonella]
MTIPLYVESGVAYVWNSNDWYTLRTEYRICGALIGTVPAYPRQNEFSGLPMALMSEETALLVDKGICELFELPTITDKLTQQEVEEIKSEEQRVFQEQMKELKKRKVEQMSQKIDIIIAGKRQKLLSKGITDANLDKNLLLQEEINKLQPLPPAQLLVHLPTEHYIDIEKKHVGVDILKPSILENFGATRYAIFKDLWERGHHITSGSKFSSDFLVYPGDPVKFHAMYMVRCLCDQTTSFCPLSLVAYGRLSVAVNKIAILASRNSYGKVDYQTLQWHDSIHR